MASEVSVPIKKLTHGPKFHWFGYYDKLEFDPTGRYVLGMEVDFEHRSPTASDTIKIGMVDLADGNRWIELGSSSAWCWQQGCMLQWRPGSADEILWNDREGDHFVCHILNVRTGSMRTIPHPIYTVSPDGRTAVTPDFSRINDMRPGYGYAGIPDPNADKLAPDDSGIWRVDLETGQAELIISLARIAAIPYPYKDLSKTKLYFNHLLFNPDGSRFVFLVRWWGPRGITSRHSRMFTANPDGSDLRLVVEDNLKDIEISHFIWRDPQHLNVWVKSFMLYKDDGSGIGEVILEAEDGHQNYLPGNEWMVYDAYPIGRTYRPLYLYHIESKKIIELGRFYSPPEYDGEWRCDLHPRIGPGGRSIVIDSVHEGDGRQLYLLDISEIIAQKDAKK